MLLRDLGVSPRVHCPGVGLAVPAGQPDTASLAAGKALSKPASRHITPLLATLQWRLVAFGNKDSVLS